MGDDRRGKGLTTSSSSSPVTNRVDGAEGLCVPIRSDRDIIMARQKGRELASRLGFSAADTTLIATAISELARNILLYAGNGEIGLRSVRHQDKRGIGVVARDEGPGIPDIHRALLDGFSTSRSLGLGLPGVRRLMDKFEIVSETNRGTTVTVTKWVS